MNRKGITLVAVIMVIVLLAIIVGGITSYIFEGLSFNVSNINQEKALYMAQAGIMKGLAVYKNTGLFAIERNINVAGEFYYHLGTTSGFLSIDASAPKISSKQLREVHIKNLDSTTAITITSIIVEWAFGGNITSVKLGNTFVWSGSLTSPANITLSPAITLNPGQSYSAQNDQIWRFSNALSGDIICTFIFSGGTSRKCYLLKNGGGANNEFPLAATGEIRSGAAPVARRTLIATYDIGTGNITSWQESQNHIIP